MHRPLVGGCDPPRRSPQQALRAACVAPRRARPVALRRRGRRRPRLLRARHRGALSSRERSPPPGRLPGDRRGPAPDAPGPVSRAGHSQPDRCRDCHNGHRVVLVDVRDRALRRRRQPLLTGRGTGGAVPPAGRGARRRCRAHPDRGRAPSLVVLVARLRAAAATRGRRPRSARAGPRLVRGGDRPRPRERRRVYRLGARSTAPLDDESDRAGRRQGGGVDQAPAGSARLRHAGHAAADARALDQDDRSQRLPDGRGLDRPLRSRDRTACGRRHPPRSSQAAGGLPAAGGGGPRRDAKSIRHLPHRRRQRTRAERDGRGEGEAHDPVARWARRE